MPSLEHYRSQMGATNRIRLVKNARPTSENVGDALTAAGEVLARVERARAESELADLDTEAKRQMDALYRSLEQDGEGNYGDFEKRLTEGSQQIRSELSKKARSGFARKALDTRFDDIETSYIVKTRNLQARRGAEEMKAGVIADMAALEDIAKDTSVLFDDPKNPQARTFKSERAAVDAKINSLVRGGFIGRDGAAELKVRLDNLSEGALSYRHQKEISARLDNGQYAQAEEYLKMHYAELTPEARDQAEAAVEKMKDEGQAYEKADEFWAAADGDYGKALDMARKEKDPTLRAKIESRLTTRKEQENQADAMQQREVYSQGLGALQAGKSVPADVMMAAKPETRDLWTDWQYQQRQRRQSLATLSAQEKAALREYESYVTKSIEGLETTDVDLFVQGPDAWKSAAPTMYDRYISLGIDDQKAIDNKIEKLRTEGKQASTVDTVYKQLLAEAKRAIPEMEGKNAEDKKWYPELTGRLRAAAETEARESGGKPITVARVREIVGAEAGTVMKGGGWFSKARPIYEADPEVLKSGNDVERRRAALSILSAEPVYARAARTTLAGQGVTNPTEAELALEALRLKSADEREQLQEGVSESLTQAGDMLGRMIGVAR